MTRERADYPQSCLDLPGHAWRRAGVFLAGFLLFTQASSGYSVLSHEAIIDSAWDASIKPLLLARYSQAKPDELKEAHAYAYAGCIIQDMGYYPFGSRFFSDLVHYVRSGDFVASLVRQAQNLDEYAFALGALAHYSADTFGHTVAVNRAVALEYPKLRRKFGDRVTYADKPSAHMQVEFGFDVVEVANGNYAPQAYHDFIGFQVSRPMLERAFRETYSLELSDVFADLDLALNTYRHTVSSLIPAATEAAWRLKGKELAAAQPGLTHRHFVYNLSHASYQKEWKGAYRQPGLVARLLAFLVRILPRIGPLKTLNFRTPLPETIQLFQSSFDRTMGDYQGLLAAQASGTLAPANRDLDTGEPTRPAEYPLADTAYGELARRLAEKSPASVNPQLRADVIAFFRDPSLPFAGKAKAAEWRATLNAVEKLKNP